MVARFNELPGARAVRIPLSGAASGFKGDIQLTLYPTSAPLVAEVKARENGAGWKTIKEWLGDNDLLVLIEDRSEPLVVVPWYVFEDLFSGGGRKIDRVGGGIGYSGSRYGVAVL